MKRSALPCVMRSIAQHGSPHPDGWAKQLTHRNLKNHRQPMIFLGMQRRCSGYPWHENISKRQVKAPKIYLRDSGLLHALLDIPTLRHLHGHPKVGASWEGFVIESLLCRIGARPDQCYLWATHAGAELDLLVVAGRRRLGFEIKRTVAPRATPSMRLAWRDLSLDSLSVIHAGADTFPIAEGIRAIGLSRYIASSIEAQSSHARSTPRSVPRCAGCATSRVQSLATFAARLGIRAHAGCRNGSPPGERAAGRGVGADPRGAAAIAGASCHATEGRRGRCPYMRCKQFWTGSGWRPLVLPTRSHTQHHRRLATNCYHRRMQHGMQRTERRFVSASRLLGLLLVCVSVGCSARTPAARPTQQRFVTPGKSSATYRTHAPAGTALRGEDAGPLGKVVADAFARRTPAPAPDPRLAQLGEWIAAALNENGGPPPAAVIDLWTRQLGLVEPTPHMVVLGAGSARALEDPLREEIAALLQRQRYSHYGLATRERAGTVFAVLVISWRWLELEPLPRAVAAGSKLQLRGRLLGGLRDAQLVVAAPDGSSQHSASQSGTRFVLPIPLRGTGAHRVEVLAGSEFGTTVAANFPLYVGVPAQSSIEITTDTAAPLSEDEALDRFVTLINQERRRAGLAPVERNTALDKVALAHSQDMHQHGFVGHTSPTTGSAEQRVTRAGIRTGMVAENIGRGYSPDEVHRGLMDSPGHRANLLQPLATHLGLGLVLEREDERTVYLLTQLFARFARKVDLDDARDQLRDALNTARSRRGARPLSDDTTLSQACTEAARAFFTSEPGSSRDRLLERLQRKAAASAKYRRMAVVMTVVSAVDEAAKLQALLDPAARALALGLAQGTRSDTVEHAIAIVAIVGY